MQQCITMHVCVTAHALTDRRIDACNTRRIYIYVPSFLNQNKKDAKYIVSARQERTVA